MNGPPIDIGYERARRALEKDIQAVKDATLRTIDLLAADAERRRKRIKAHLSSIERSASEEWRRPSDSEAAG